LVLFYYVCVLKYTALVFHPHSGIWMYCKWGLEKHVGKCALNVAVLRQGILCTEVAILWDVMECFTAFLNFTEYEAHSFKNSINALSFFLSFFLSFTFMFISWHEWMNQETPHNCYSWLALPLRFKIKKAMIRVDVTVGIETINQQRCIN
jgi:hypothetical protein